MGLTVSVIPTSCGLGRGHTKLWAGSGHTKLWAGSGHTKLWAGSGHTKLWAGSGHTKLWAGSGHTKLWAGSGHTKLWAGSGQYMNILFKLFNAHQTLNAYTIRYSIIWFNQYRHYKIITHISSYKSKC